jgi:hypothetical protein
LTRPSALATKTIATSADHDDDDWKDDWMKAWIARQEPPPSSLEAIEATVQEVKRTTKDTKGQESTFTTKMYTLPKYIPARQQAGANHSAKSEVPKVIFQSWKSQQVGEFKYISPTFFIAHLRRLFPLPAFPPSHLYIHILSLLTTAPRSVCAHAGHFPAPAVAHFLTERGDGKMWVGVKQTCLDGKHSAQNGSTAKKNRLRWHRPLHRRIQLHRPRYLGPRRPHADLRFHDVDPASGKPTGGTHEISRAKIGPGDGQSQKTRPFATFAQ